MEDIKEEKDLEVTDERNNGEIDLIELAKKLWTRRKTIILWCVIGALIGLVIGFSIPKEYTTQVKLAPEISNSGSASKNLGALAAMAGISTTSNSSDAVYPQLYPDIMKSVPFCLALFNIPLTDVDGANKFTLEEYLKDYTSEPWWSVITGAPGKLMGLLSSSKEITAKGQDNTLIRLTKEQDKLIKRLNSAIATSVDEKTSVVTISVSMQDPVVSAILADTVAGRLKEYVTQYRTDKARQDLYYIDKLNEEAREKYYAAQQRYANYLDTHQGIVLYSAQTMRDRLENEATLAFNVFNQTSQQLQMAKAKVQEVTPVYATIEPAAVPIKASKPRKVLILAGFIFLAFVGACAKILFYEPMKNKFKQTEVPAGNKTYEPGEE
ncbi:MAG: chain-length determining protein [Bacteroidales bacterium]|nr:chain-length determining protein [Bacteroidales bacterium]